MFQKVVKLSGKYWRAWHNGKYMTEKCYRVFASVDANDSYIGKAKDKNATIEKFGNTPDNCFIDNGNVNEKKVPSHLDRRWYINLAKDRLKQYGVEV
jgi:DNA polymerase